MVNEFPHVRFPREAHGLCFWSPGAIEVQDLLGPFGTFNKLYRANHMRVCIFRLIECQTIFSNDREARPETIVIGSETLSVPNLVRVPWFELDSGDVIASLPTTTTLHSR